MVTKDNEQDERPCLVGYIYETKNDVIVTGVPYDVSVESSDASWDEVHHVLYRSQKRQPANPNVSSPLDLAILFHQTYERLAPTFGYETREATKEFDPDSPNGKLMQAVCEHVMQTMPALTIGI